MSEKQRKSSQKPSTSSDSKRAQKMAQNTSIAAEETVFFMCDMQEKFQQVIQYFPEITAAAEKLLQTSRLLDIPLIVTEQYPTGLGPTVQTLDVSHAVGIFPKTKFSMVIPEVTKFLDGPVGKARRVVVLFGIEAHVCVEQTALDLLSLGKFVHVAADATSSRSQEDRKLAFDRLRQVGCFVTTTEAVIFRLLRDKNHPLFNEFRQLFKTSTLDTGLAKM